LAYKIGLQDWLTKLAYKIGLQDWLTRLAYKIGLQNLVFPFLGQTSQFLRRLCLKDLPFLKAFIAGNVNEPQIWIEATQEDGKKWRGYIDGAPNTPYENGR
jgi:hypothetical protein